MTEDEFTKWMTGKACSALEGRFEAMRTMLLDRGATDEEVEAVMAWQTAEIAQAMPEMVATAWRALDEPDAPSSLQ